MVLHPVAICASGCWARSNRKLLWGEYTGSTELPRVLRVGPAMLPGAPNQPLATRVTGVAPNTHIVCVSGGHRTIESHHDSEPIDLRPFRAVQQVAAGPNHPNCALELKSALQFEISIRGQIRHAIYAGKRCCLKSEQTQAQEGALCHDGAQAQASHGARGGRARGGGNRGRGTHTQMSQLKPIGMNIPADPLQGLLRTTGSDEGIFIRTRLVTTLTWCFPA